MSVRNILMAAAGAQPSLNVADVFSAYPYSGTGVAQSLSPGVDLSTYGGLFWSKSRTTTGAAVGHRLFDSERGNNFLDTSSTAAQSGNTGVSLTTSGVNLTSSGVVNASGYTYIGWMFRKAAKFFDVVCSQSTPSGNLSFSHGLGVVPELIIHKDSGFASDWDVWTTAFGGKHYLKLNSTSAATSVSHPSTLTATTVFSGYGSQTSNSPQVCYLFASLPGISKVGSYAGNGSSQTIPCGFTTGARFILIKRTDSTGDWYVWDTARGIVSANDPHLKLNTSDVEVTINDSVDPDASGFIVNQVAATNINVTGATYIFLAVS